MLYMQSPTVRYEPLLLRRLNRPWKQGAQKCDPTWWSTIKSWGIWAINNGGWVFSHRIICYIYIYMYWLVVWNINFIWLSHHIGNVIIPTDELHHFSGGLVQPPTSICVCVCVYIPKDAILLVNMRIAGGTVPNVRTPCTTWAVPMTQ